MRDQTGEQIDDLRIRMLAYLEGFIPKGTINKRIHNVSYVKDPTKFTIALIEPPLVSFKP